MWSTEVHAQSTCRAAEGHKTLQKLITILGHLCELLRQRPQNPEYGRAFALQAYKASLEALKNNGNWELAWPLLGIPSPDENLESIVAPAERVALVALQKERRMLKEAADKVGKGE
jgi:hypothetical protein